jgi:hypothetical protein
LTRRFKSQRKEVAVGHGERIRGLKRTVNDRIFQVLEGTGLVEADFLCECAIESCERTVRLGLAEYSSLDGNRTRLIDHAPVEQMHASVVSSFPPAA